MMISGERSSAMPPMARGGMARRSGPRTGSVMESRKTRTLVSAPPPGLGGNQLRMIRAKMASR